MRTRKTGQVHDGPVGVSRVRQGSNMEPPLQAALDHRDLVICRNKEKPITSKQIGIMKRKRKPFLSRTSLKTGGGASCFRLHCKLKRKNKIFSPIFFPSIPNPLKVGYYFNSNNTQHTELVTSDRNTGRTFKGKLHVVTSSRKRVIFWHVTPCSPASNP